MEHQITVENIKCGGCMTSIQNALLKLDLVEKVTIDEASATIFITGSISREKIMDKLNALGYPKKGDNSPLKIAKSYVNCAIGKMNS